MWAHSGIRGAADGVLADLEANGILSTLLEGDKPSQNSPEQQAVSRQAPNHPFLTTTGLRTAVSIRSREYDDQPLAYAGCSFGSQIVMYSSCSRHFNLYCEMASSVQHNLLYPERIAAEV